MSDLIEFLLARISEDEQNIDGDWTEGYDLHIISSEMYDRLRRECAAKRKVVGLHGGEHVCPSGNGLGCTDYDPSGEDAGLRPCPTLCAAATVYADHPAFRQEWLR